MELKTYCYYSITDPKKESIDKTNAFDEIQALEYFAGRKQMSKETFSKLYIITYDIQPK